MFNYKESILYCEKVNLKKLAKKIQTPFYVYSKKQIIKNYTEFDNAFKEVPHIICYSIKANPNISICKVIFGLGAGADVTSKGELLRALSAGCSNKKIVFAGVGKKIDELKLAIEKNILMINIESIQELKLINTLSKSINKKTNVALRINPNINPYTHKFVTTSKYENKFGIYLEEVPLVLKLLKRMKNINLLGLHCHIGSQITSINPFVKATKIMKELIIKFKKEKLHISHLNLGGGLGIKYKDEIPPTPKELANSILPILKGLNLVLIFEPGRYIVGDAGAIVTKVLYLKSSPHKNFIVVDASMNEIIRPALYDAYHKIIPLVKGSRKFQKYDIVGPICETTDFIGKDRYFPTPRIGDYLSIMCAGAYCSSMASEYNSRPKAPEILVDGENFKIIRREQNFMETLALEKTEEP